MSMFESPLAVITPTQDLLNKCENIISSGGLESLLPAMMHTQWLIQNRASIVYSDDGRFELDSYPFSQINPASDTAIRMTDQYGHESVAAFDIRTNGMPVRILGEPAMELIKFCARHCLELLEEEYENEVASINERMNELHEIVPTDPSRELRFDPNVSEGCTRIIGSVGKIHFTVQKVDTIVLGSSIKEYSAEASTVINVPEDWFGIGVSTDGCMRTITHTFSGDEAQKLFETTLPFLENDRFIKDLHAA